MNKKNITNLVHTVLMWQFFFILLILKATGVITISWWLVTAPLWLGFAVVVAMFVIAGILGGLASVLK